MKAIEAVLGQPWVIEPEWLGLISAIAQRQFDAPVVTAARDNRPRTGAPGLFVKDGIARIGIIGPIFPRANLVTEVSGATSIEMVQAQFRAAMASSDVKSIVLQIDSPGGAVTGTADFAAEIAAARSIKPIVAVATGDMASGAYWIGSAASSIVVSSTSRVGSIGVVAGMSKQVLPDANGEMQVEIVSSNAPNKRPDPTDSAGKSSILAAIDAVEHQFIATVARHRGVTQAAVKSDFGQGGVLVGSAAVKAGMVDRVGTIESVLAGLAAASSAHSATPRAAAAASSEHPNMTTPTTVAELTASYPEIVAQIRSEAVAGMTTSEAALAAARADGAKAERERLAGIESAALPGHDALVAACKADAACTPGDAALRINAAERAKLNAAGAAIQNVEKMTGKVSAATTSQPTGPADVPQTAEGWKAEWAASAALQADFRTAEAYVGYRQGVKEGRIRVLKAPTVAA